MQAKPGTGHRRNKQRLRRDPSPCPPLEGSRPLGRRPARSDAIDARSHLSATIVPRPALANNYGERLAWQLKTSVDAASALLNSHASYGAVAATASNSGYSVPLNATGAVNASTLNVTGNSASAASNTVTVSSHGRLPTASIANAQVNYGPVTAQVTGASYRIASGPLSGSALPVTGNQIAATAMGNQASSTIAATR